MKQYHIELTDEDTLLLEGLTPMECAFRSGQDHKHKPLTYG